MYQRMINFVFIPCLVYPNCSKTCMSMFRFVCECTHKGANASQI